MDYLGDIRRFMSPGSAPVSLGWHNNGDVTFFCPRIEILGDRLRIWKYAQVRPRPTYQVGRILFLDGEGFCLKQFYLEQEKMNFGFWSVAAGSPTEKTQHYDDSIERRGSQNYYCFVGENEPGSIQIPVPGIPRSSTQYMKEPLTPLDDLLPEDFDQSLCRIAPKQEIRYYAGINSVSIGFEYVPERASWESIVVNVPFDPPNIPYYVPYEPGPFVVAPVAHEENGFTRYFDPRRHGNGNWAQGFVVELFPDAGDVSLDIRVDLYKGM